MNNENYKKIVLSFSLIFLFSLYVLLTPTGALQIVLAPPSGVVAEVSSSSDSTSQTPSTYLPPSLKRNRVISSTAASATGGKPAETSSRSSTTSVAAVSPPSITPKPVPISNPSPAPTPIASLPPPTPVLAPASPPPAPVPTPAPAPVQTGQYRDGTYTGSIADAYYGNVQVQATIQGGKITNVQFLDYPKDRQTSVIINSQAMPYLISEAIQAQSANVNVVSGATASSGAFQQSLASALAQA
jgi:uncharacterized protein with FMN-binding domain